MKKENRENGRRGIAISMDALLTLGLLMATVVALSSLAPPNPNESGALVDLRHVEMGALEAMEKTGRLAQAAAGNGAAVGEVLDAYGGAACFNVTIRSHPSSALVGEYLKDGCGAPGPEDEQVYAYRSFAVANGTYLVRMAGWYG